MERKAKSMCIGMNHTFGDNKNATEGITLVALVITIIVLLILAGVAVVSLTGDNGIIKKAQEAKDKTEQGTKAEQEALNNLLETMNQLQGGNTGETKPTTPAGTPLPNGFVYVGGTVAEGVIISDNVVDEAKGITHEVAQTLQGNQFVWIPVETPVANSQEELTTLLAEGKLPMAVKQSDGNYRGVLYDVDASGKFTAKSYALNTSFREPDVVTGNSTGDGTQYDAITSNLAKAGVSNFATFKTQMQSEYNKTVESVIVNKGFYVARYEASITVDNKVESKARKNPMNASTNSGDTWYGMYAKSKQLTSNPSSVTTGMIWGSHWDQMMIYMKDVKNIIDSSKLFIKDGTGMGNYTGNKLATGSNASYNVKGIYDIAGNYFAWTMETLNDNGRVLRGGSYLFTGTNTPVTARLYDNPDRTDSDDGARLMLCI